MSSNPDEYFCISVCEDAICSIDFCIRVIEAYRADMEKSKEGWYTLRAFEVEFSLWQRKLLENYIDLILLKDKGSDLVRCYVHVRLLQDFLSNSSSLISTWKLSDSSEEEYLRNRLEKFLHTWSENTGQDFLDNIYQAQASGKIEQLAALIRIEEVKKVEGSIGGKTPRKMSTLYKSRLLEGKEKSYLSAFSC